MKIRVQHLLLILVALAVAACSALSPRVDPKFPAVTVYGRNVVVDNLTDHVLDDGTPQVVVYARSTSGYQRPLRYRALWSDNAGRPIATTVSNWSELNADGRRAFEMTFVGPGNRAHGYRIEIEVLKDN